MKRGIFCGFLMFTLRHSREGGNPGSTCFRKAAGALCL